MIFVFFLFTVRPLLALSLCSDVRSFCRSSVLSAISTASSPYRMLLFSEPLILILSVWTILCIMFSAYSEKRSGDSTHPCLTPRIHLGPFTKIFIDRNGCDLFFVEIAQRSEIFFTISSQSRSRCWCIGLDTVDVRRCSFSFDYHDPN